MSRGRSGNSDHVPTHPFFPSGERDPTTTKTAFVGPRFVVVVGETLTRTGLAGLTYIGRWVAESAAWYLAGVELLLLYGFGGAR